MRRRQAFPAPTLFRPQGDHRRSPKASARREAADQRDGRGWSHVHHGYSARSAITGSTFAARRAGPPSLLQSFRRRQGYGGQDGVAAVYSVRSASMGSTLLALLAGIQQASSAIASRSSSTAA